MKKVYKKNIHSIVLLSLIILFCCDSQAVAQQKEFNLIHIHVADTRIIEELEANPHALELVRQIRNYDLHYVSNISPGFLWAIVSDNDLTFLKERNYRIEEIIKGPEIELHKRMVWGKEMQLPQGYHTYSEIVAELQEITQQHPDICALHSIGQTQQHKKDIYAIKLSDNVQLNEDEPKVLFSAAIHGNEIMGAEVCLALLQKIIKNYKNDDTLSRYVNTLEIWFVPAINVDGYEIATTLHPSWRKNARDNDNDGAFSLADGVDLNRNFDFNWQFSGSNDPSSRFYRGTAPMSESETRALADFVQEHKFVFSVTYHSAESRVYYPWRREGSYTSEDSLLSAIANTVAQRIPCINQNYHYQAVRNIWEASYTTNFYYGKLGTIDFIIELGKYDHVYPKPILENIIEHNLNGAFYLLDRALGPGLTGVVTDAETGQPIYAEVRILDSDDATTSPRMTDPKTGRYWRVLFPGTYQVLVTDRTGKSYKSIEVVVEAKGWTECNVEL